MLRETSKDISEIDIDLVYECLYFLYPANEEEDRAFIDRTLPILRQKLGFDEPRKRLRKRVRVALIAAVITVSVLLAGSLVAYALGFDIIAFFRESAEHWTVQIQTEEVSDMPSAETLDIPLEDYRIWGDAVVQAIAEMGIRPDLPKEFPEEYSLASIDNKTVDSFFDELKALYVHENGQYFRLIIRNYRYGFSGSDYQLQKDSSIQETTMHNGIEIGLARNYDTVSATWMTDSCSVYIYGTCAMETLEAMINSI